MLRDELLTIVQTGKSPVMPVPTPELPEQDGKIFVRRASPRELQANSDRDQQEGRNERCDFVVLVAADSEGTRIFSDEDSRTLADSPALMPVVERLYWAGLRHNGLTREQRELSAKNS